MSNRSFEVYHQGFETGLRAQSSELRVDVVIRFSGLPVSCLPAKSSARGLTPEGSETRGIMYYLKPSFRGLELELDLSADDVITMGIVKICCTVGPKLWQNCSK